MICFALKDDKDNNDKDNNKNEESSELYGLAAWCKVWCDYCEYPDEKIGEEMLRRMKNAVNKKKK